MQAVLAKANWLCGDSYFNRYAAGMPSVGKRTFAGKIKSVAYLAHGSRHWQVNYSGSPVKSLLRQSFGGEMVSYQQIDPSSSQSSKDPNVLS